PRGLARRAPDLLAARALSVLRRARHRRTDGAAGPAAGGRAHVGAAGHPLRRHHRRAVLPVVRGDRPAHAPHRGGGHVRAFAAALLVCCAGCSYFHATPGPYRPPGLANPPGAATGQQLYLRDCAWCHGDKGGGTSRAPDLRTGTNGPALTDFELRTGRMPLANMSEPVRRRPRFYSEPQIEAIVGYVATLGGKGPAVPSPHPDRGSL